MKAILIILVLAMLGLLSPICGMTYLAGSGLANMLVSAIGFVGAGFGFGMIPGALVIAGLTIFSLVTHPIQFFKVGEWFPALCITIVTVCILIMACYSHA